LWNYAGGNQSTVSGGQSNTAEGHFSAVLGGSCGSADGDFSVAIGVGAEASKTSSVVISATNNNSPITDANSASCSADSQTFIPCEAQGPNTVTICAPEGLYLNGVKIGSNGVPGPPGPSGASIGGRRGETGPPGVCDCKPDPLTQSAIGDLEQKLDLSQKMFAQELLDLRKELQTMRPTDSARSGALTVGSHAGSARHSTKAAAAPTSILPWASAAVVGVVAAVIAAAVATKKKRALTATVSEGAPLVGAHIFA
jgi:hypothetical protein